jgi:amino acid transporter
MEPTWLNTRLVAFSCLTSVCLVHGTLLQLGLRLQNTLGVVKLFVFALISVSGILCLVGATGFQVRDEYEKPNNFIWDKFWEGSGTGSNAFINGLYNVIWYESSASGVTCLCLFLTTSSRSFNGYSTINSVLSEVHNPVRTLKLAAPLAMLSVTAVYLFINLSYFAVVSKTDILESRQIVALVIQIVSGILVFNCFLRALYFRNLFGPTTEKVGFCYVHTDWFVATHTIGP